MVVYGEISFSILLKFESFNPYHIIHQDK